MIYRRLKMSLAETYLANARAQLNAAATATLPNRRAMYERAAETWETMARSIRDTEVRAATNLAAKSDNMAKPVPLPGRYRL